MFHENLSLIEQVVGGVCRRRRVFGAGAEDFASTVKVALIENNYATLRKYEGRSPLPTYLTIAVERMLFGQRALRLAAITDRDAADLLAVAEVEDLDLGLVENGSDRQSTHIGVSKVGESS